MYGKFVIEKNRVQSVFQCTLHTNASSISRTNHLRFLYFLERKVVSKISRLKYFCPPFYIFYRNSFYFLILYFRVYCMNIAEIFQENILTTEKSRE